MATEKKPDYLDRVLVDPEILLGKPVIKGTRIPVSLILNLLANGADTVEITTDYPDLTDKDVQAAIAYAADRIDREATATIPRPM